MTDNLLGPGSRIGQYVIGQRVGSGGMAVVFSAHDESLGRTVALKVLSPALAHDEEFRQRFLRESRSVAAVEEPHIVPVYASGESDGVLYIVTRFVPGGDLGTLLRRQPGPFPPERAASVVSQVAAALDAAHGIGLVHRDVKPGNILIDSTPGRSEHAYLSDFGLSKATSSATDLTASGVFLGTPDYCAPEQITGRPPVGARADQYSLACVAFSLLTGTVPYAREQTMATLFAHVQDPVPSLVARGPWLPPPVDAVIARAMAKDPAARFESCGAFAAALTAALRAPAGTGYWPPAGRPAFPPGSATIPTRIGDRGPGGRRTAIIAGSVAAAVVLIGGGIATALALSHHQPALSLQEELTGTWAGTYTCSQGITGLQLAIKAGAGGSATATFSFYALQSNSSVPAGEFAMTGTYSASGVKLNPGRWIIQPANYETVGLAAGPLTSGGKTMSGTVTNPSCTTFTVTKTG